MYLKIGMQITHSRIFLVLLLIVLVALSSCADLGNYTGESDYYSYFSSVSYYKNYNKTNSSMEDFYNEDSYDDTNIKSSIEEDKYQAFIISIEKELNMSDFYIYFSASTSQTLNFEFYVTNENLETEEIEIPDPADDTKKVSITRFKELNAKPLLTSSRTINKKFNSLRFNQSTKKLNPGDNLIILFSDNCDLDNSNDISFTFTNVLIRNENL